MIINLLKNQLFCIFIGLSAGTMAILPFGSYLNATILNQVSQKELYVLTNEARISNDLGRLQVNPNLELAAQLKLADMFQGNYFAHTSPAGIKPWSWFNKVHYGYRLAGENLAMNFLSSDEVVNSWLKSESHRRNLLSKYFKETGIAVGSGIINGEMTMVVVQVFGTPQISVVRDK